jgi:hypothetical protein
MANPHELARITYRKIPLKNTGETLKRPNGTVLVTAHWFFNSSSWYSKNNENVTCLRIIRKKIVTYENLLKTCENKIF